MERPSRRNLFDDSEEEDEEKEYKPTTIEPEQVVVSAEGEAEPLGELIEAQAAPEEEKEEGAINLNQEVRVNQFMADQNPTENDLAQNLDDEDDEEYVPSAEPEKPMVVAQEQEPQMEEVDVAEPIVEQAPVVVETPEQMKTNAEKKLKEDAEKAKNQLLKEIKGFHIDDADH